MRKTKFQTGEYYHIYNRGVDKRKVFMDEKDYVKFVYNLNILNNDLTKIERKNFISECRSSKSAPSAGAALGADFEILSKLPKLVDIICYCLIPNHYHFMLKQIADNGISKFMHKLADSYGLYFNKKHNRSGSLFQGPFKEIHIKKDSYLLWLSGYINGNPEIHKIAKAENYKWSSYQDYLGKRNGNLCDKNVILKDFKNIREYKDLVDIIIKESRQKKSDIRKYMLE